MLYSMMLPNLFSEPQIHEGEGGVLATAYSETYVLLTRGSIACFHMLSLKIHLHQLAATFVQSNLFDESSPLR